MKGFRKILKIQHPFYSRKSNQEVMQQINDHKPGEDPIKSISEILKERKVKLLAHCIRADPSDPLRQPILRMTDSRMIEVLDKRVGRPRIRWVVEAFKFAYKMLFPECQFDPKNMNHQDEIIRAARNREI